MKRKIALLVVLTLCISCISITSVFAATPINVCINGNELIFFDQRPVMKNDRVLVPMRSIFEALGADVQWDDASQTVTGTLDDRVVKATIGSTEASVSGEAITLDVGPELINDRTMVPVRFISESLGADVDWKDETQTVEITADLGKCADGEVSNVHPKGTKRPVPTEFEKSSEMTSENLVYFPMPQSPSEAFKKLQGGTVIMENEDFVDLYRMSQGMPEYGSMEVKDENGQKVFRFTCTNPPTSTWMMNYRINLPDDFVFETGDMFVFKASAKLIEGGDFDTREGSVALLLGEGTYSKNEEVTNGLGSTWTSVGKDDWKEIYHAGVLDKEIDDTCDYYVGVEWDKYAQVVEVKDLQLIYYKKGTCTYDDLPGNTYPYKGYEEDAQWRKDALERIEQIRKGDISVVVKDASGNVIPNADVSLDMFEHEFLWATDYGETWNAANDGVSSLEDNYLNNPQRPTNKRNKLVENFNSIGITIHKRKFNEAENMAYGAANKVVEFVQGNGIDKSIRGHALFWDFGLDQLIELYGEECFDGTEEGKALLQRKIREHIFHVAELFPMIDDVDVTNEDGSRTGMGSAQQGTKPIYGKEILIDIYKAAREAFPNAKLALTDGYAGMSTNSSMWVNNQKPLLDWAVENLDFDILGYQGHIGYDFSPEEVVDGLEILKGYGKNIRVTEFDNFMTNNVNMQGNAARDALIAYFACDAVEKIQFWSMEDYSKENTQRVIYNYMMDELKPGGVAFQDLVYNKWWTREKGTTGSDGAFSTRGYYGDYTITASANGSSAKVDVHLGKDDPREVVIVIE